MTLPDVDRELVSGPVIVRVELLAVLTVIVQGCVECLLPLLCRGAPGHGPVNRRRRWGGTEDSGGAVRPQSTLAGRSAVLPRVQAGNSNLRLPRLHPRVVLEVLPWGAVVGHVGIERDVPVCEFSEEKMIVCWWRLVMTRVKVRVATVVDDTLQFAPVHVVGLPPVAGGGPHLTQLRV